MRVLLSGSGGLIGGALAESLGLAGWDVVRLVRNSLRVAADSAVAWDPSTGWIDREQLDGIDAVVHLAGEPVFGFRWTAAKKHRIRASRVLGTQLLATALARLDRPPKVFACASAIGYYGDRGAEELTEQSQPGEGFLPEVCVAWENAAGAAREAGIRVVHLRFGLVLSLRGGALAKMLPAFRCGLGGRLGDGRQYVSWITLNDACRAVEHVLRGDTPAGPFNVVAPEPITNAELTRALAAQLRRPAVLPVPAVVLRLALGEMADAMLLSSARVLPARLASTGFVHEDSRLELALERMLAR